MLDLAYITLAISILQQLKSSILHGILKTAPLALSITSNK